MSLVMIGNADNIFRSSMDSTEKEKSIKSIVEALLQRAQDHAVDSGGIRKTQKTAKKKETQPHRPGSARETTSIVGFSVLGLICLLGYSYVEFLGWLYLTKGNSKTSLALMAVFAVILITTSFLMPRFWSSNSAFVSKRRNLLMTIAGIIFSVAMVLSFIGVSNFARVYNDREEIRSLYDKGVNEARGLYPDYDNYVRERLSRYEEILKHAIEEKSSNPKMYMEYVGNFPGESDTRRVSNLTKSLKRTLQPTNDKLQENFNEWLDGVGEANVWNMSFASNVSVLDHRVSSCVSALSAMSSRYFHPGEEKIVYDYKAYSSNDKLLLLISSREFYISWKSLLIFILTAFTLIMPTLRDGLRSRKDI